MKQLDMYMQPLDEMERVCRKELGERFDEILDKIEKDNVGFVITDKGKHDVVICPAKWFSFQFDDDFGCVINSAVRYAIGRHTYMPGVVCDFVSKYLDILDIKTINVMIEDIDHELKFGIDQEELWIELRSKLLQRQNKINEHYQQKDTEV